MQRVIIDITRGMRRRNVRDAKPSRSRTLPCMAFQEPQRSARYATPPQRLNAKTRPSVQTGAEAARLDAREAATSNLQPPWQLTQGTPWRASLVVVEVYIEVIAEFQC